VYISKPKEHSIHKVQSFGVFWFLSVQYILGYGFLPDFLIVISRGIVLVVSDNI
jgi:hypothetical protein